MVDKDRHAKRNTSTWTCSVGTNLPFTPNIRWLQGRQIKWFWCGFLQSVFLPPPPPRPMDFLLFFSFFLSLSCTVFISMFYYFSHFFSLRLSLRFIPVLPTIAMQIYNAFHFPWHCLHSQGKNQPFLARLCSHPPRHSWMTPDCYSLED